MKNLFLGLTGAVLAALVLLGQPEAALFLAAAYTIAEFCSMGAADALAVSGALELNEKKLAGKKTDALLLTFVGGALGCGLAAWIASGKPLEAEARKIVFAMLTGALYALARLLFTLAQLEGKKGACLLLALAVPCVPLAALVLPFDLYISAAAIMGAICLIALPFAGVRGFGVPRFEIRDGMAFTRLPILNCLIGVACIGRSVGVAGGFSLAAAWTALGIFYSDTQPDGAEKERYPVRWLAAALLVLLVTLLHAERSISDVPELRRYADIAAALLTAVGAGMAIWNGGKTAARNLPCLLLLLAEAFCSLIPWPFSAAACLVPVLFMAWLLRANLYAAWLPVRAWFIRRHASR